MQISPARCCQRGIKREVASLDPVNVMVSVVVSQVVSVMGLQKPANLSSKGQSLKVLKGVGI